MSKSHNKNRLLPATFNDSDVEFSHLDRSSFATLNQEVNGIINLKPPIKRIS